MNEMRDVIRAWRRNRPRAAARLRSLRLAAGLTQLDLAAQSGITHEAISRLELATRSPRAETIRRLAAALGIDPVEFVRQPAPPADV
jgi:transcriptional regulator with XRE-family HTH domain